MRFTSLFLCLAATAVAFAEPPKVPKSLAAKPGELVMLRVEGKELGYAVSFEPTDVFFGELVTKEPGVQLYVLQVKRSKLEKIDPGTRNPATQLTLTFWTGGEKTGAVVQLDTTGALLPPGDGTDPPVKPIPTGTRLFCLVRKDGPAPAGFSAVLKLPEWAELEKAGHDWKDFTEAEARAEGIKVPDGTTLPAVITYQKTDAGVFVEVGKPRAIPRTGAEVLDLAK